VVVVQLAGIHQRHIALAVAGDDLFVAGADFIGQPGQVGASLVEGHDVL